jgi:hypothetical protein
MVGDDGCGSIRSRWLPHDLLGIEEQQFRCQYDPSRGWPESDFHRAYGIVRHPMCLGGEICLLFTPLALGSYFALIIAFIVLRLLNEENVLRQELPGSTDYCRHTHFRLVPLLW